MMTRRSGFALAAALLAVVLIAVLVTAAFFAASQRLRRACSNHDYRKLDVPGM